jgi:hypothetical protein
MTLTLAFAPSLVQHCHEYCLINHYLLGPGGELPGLAGPRALEGVWVCFARQLQLMAYMWCYDCCWKETINSLHCFAEDWSERLSESLGHRASMSGQSNTEPRVTNQGGGGGRASKG